MRNARETPQKVWGIETVNITALEETFIWFMFYSIAGWVYESLICSVGARHFVNRGFLNGPYCPIYGFGAIFDLILLGGIENPFILFFLGMAVSCTLEYFTSYGMEKIFHTRWWDYSKWKCNINGRVCLLGAIVFGMLSVVLMKWIHPFVSRYVGLLPPRAWHGIFAVLLTVLMSDCLVTIGGFAGFNGKLKELSELLEPIKSDALDKVRNSQTFATLNSAHELLAQKLSYQQKRMISVFPGLKSMKYNDILTELKKMVFNRKHRAKRQ